MKAALVSIIIPVYNSAKYLTACIDSALNQSWGFKEIILVDDGSTDGSDKILDKYAHIRGVTVIRQKNKGASAARNAGLKEATGDYIQFLDADDLLSPDKIEVQLIALNGSLTQLCICETVHFNDGENPLNGLHSKDWFYSGSNDPVDFLTKLYSGEETMPGFGGMITIHSWLTPKSLIDKAGPWNESLSLDDDGEFFCRVVLASKAIKFSNSGFNYYRKYNNRLSLSSQKNIKGIKSAVLANDLKLSYLKAKTKDIVIDRIFAKHYWWTGVLAYPQFKNLSEYCIQKAQQLGYNGKEYVGGPSGHLFAGIFGWKAARTIVYYQQLFKRVWA